MKSRATIACFVATAALAGCGGGGGNDKTTTSGSKSKIAQSNSGTTTSRGNAAPSDAAYLAATAASDGAETFTALVARGRLKSSATKDYASRLASERGKELRDLRAVARKQKMKLGRSQLSTAARDRVRSLVQARGAPDKIYLRDEITTLEGEVTRAGEASRTAKDPDVKAFAVKALKLYRHELERAKAAGAAIAG